jgi:D-glycero-D-manno-heptose 1,7-bisphosphate phosphatase
MNKGYKLIVLDRDGVINEDSDEYIPNGFQVLGRRERNRAPECTPCYMRSEGSSQRPQNLKGEGYVKSPDEWRAIPGSLEAIVKLNKAGYKVVVISNQSGIARGYFTEQTLQLIHNKMRSALSKLGGFIDYIYYCPHHPDEHCQCRKPKPKMFLEALHRFNFSLKDALIIGDAWVDMQLAKNVGCDVVLVKTGKGKKTYMEHKKDLANVLIFDNLAAVVEKELI